MPAIQVILILYAMDKLEHQVARNSPTLSQAAAGGRINVVLKSGASSLLVRDALRRPLAELELGEVSAGLSRSSPAVMQVMLTEDVGVSSLSLGCSHGRAGAGRGVRGARPLVARRHAGEAHWGCGMSSLPLGCPHGRAGAGRGVRGAQPLIARCHAGKGMMSSQPHTMPCWADAQWTKNGQSN